jgi:Stress responsive A/B Barrel Domain
VAGPGSCVVGANVTEEPLSQEFEFGFVVRFAGHAQLDAYHVNPAHLPVSLAIRDLARTVLVFDFAT